jgi:RHS repeat-associated protein
VNRLGYAGYFFEPATQQYLVRNREYDPNTGVWDERDPMGYHDGSDLYMYVGGNPANGWDPMGLLSRRAGPSPWTQCGPGWGYDPRRMQCVKIQNPWDCAAYSRSNRECYDCCNNDFSFEFSRPCYQYCNRRFRESDTDFPFLPNPGPDGPCFRESGGDATCVRQCQEVPADGISVPQIHPPNNLICCICDVSHPAVATCSSVAECVSVRMSCFALSTPASGSLMCRSLRCIAEQIECLRERSSGSQPPCDELIEQELRRWRAGYEIAKKACERER